jgi:hypothetical protein
MIIVSIKPEDAIVKLSRNVVSLLQYYAAPQPKTATTTNLVIKFIVELRCVFINYLFYSGVLTSMFHMQTIGSSVTALLRNVIKQLHSIETNGVYLQEST